MERIVSLGTDIVEVERVSALHARHADRFLRRVYTELERELARGRADPGPFLAGRFAAKEAVLKVLGCGLFAGARLADIEIRRKESGEPYCVLSGGALTRARALGIDRVLVSISHCDSFAVAQALGVGPAGPAGGRRTC